MCVMWNTQKFKKNATKTTKTLILNLIITYLGHLILILLLTTILSLCSSHSVCSFFQCPLPNKLQCLVSQTYFIASYWNVNTSVNSEVIKIVNFSLKTFKRLGLNTWTTLCHTFAGDILELMSSCAFADSAF